MQALSARTRLRIAFEELSEDVRSSLEESGIGPERPDLLREMVDEDEGLDEQFECWAQQIMGTGKKGTVAEVQGKLKELWELAGRTAGMVKRVRFAATKDSIDMTRAVHEDRKKEETKREDGDILEEALT